METSNRSKIGVYLCSEMGEIGDRIDLSELSEYMRRFDDVVEVGVHDELSSKEGLDFLVSRYLEKKFDGVLIGGAVPAIQGVVIRHALQLAGMNRYLFEMVNLREQCAWVTPDRKEATNKAKSLMLAGLQRLRRLEPLEDLSVPMKDAALVIGGGVAGMAAALHIADAGYKVYVVEREGSLGGRAYKLETTFPTHNCGICCMQYCKECVFTPKIDDILRHHNIELLLEAEVEEITGGFGCRHVTVRRGEARKELDVGVIVVATGSKTFDPARIPAYRYGSSKDILTTMEFVELMRQAERTGIRRPSTGEAPEVVNIVLCVGSRDKANGNLHCSLVCCTYAIGTAKEIKRMHPKAEVYVHYIDLRGPYRGFEEFCNEARDMGIKFVRGKVAEVLEEGGRLIVRAEDTDAGEILNIRSDLVILAVGQEPSEGTEKLSRILHIQTDVDKFMKDVNPMMPSEIRRGIYIAGCAQGPKGIRYSVDDAKSVATEVVQLLGARETSIDRMTAVVNEERCRGCGRCAEACTFHAIEIVGKNGTKVARVDEYKCEGCGVCAATCCNKSIEVTNFRADQMLPSIRSLIEEVE